MKSNNINNYKDFPKDLIEIFSTIWKNMNILIIITLLFFIFGCVYSLTLPNIYRSSSTFYPHYENIENNGFRSLAGLAGINLNNEVANNIPPNLYPYLIKSTPFKQKILNENISILGKKTSYKDYLESSKSSLNKENKSINIKKIITFFVKTIKKIFISNESENKDLNNNLDLISISENNYNLHQKLDHLITINVNEKDGFIKLNVDDTNPIVSSQIAKKAEELLQESIINFKIKNIKNLYDFTSEQLTIAKDNLYNLQDSLAKFRDKNKNIKTDLFLNQLNRIETEYNIAKNIYNELALNKQKTSIDVKKNTPIFTIINPVVLPNEKHKPARIIIVISYTVLGLIISITIIFLKKSIFKFYKSLSK